MQEYVGAFYLTIKYMHVSFYFFLYSCIKLSVIKSNIIKD